MSSIRNFTFSSNNKITAQAVDTVNKYVWIAYQQSAGVCLLNKQNAFSPDEIYFSLSKTVTKIKDLFVVGEVIVAAYDDETYIGELISTTNPLTSTYLLNIPVGVNEAPVSTIANNGFNTGVYFLTPGIAFGENAKIVKYANFIGDFDQIIDLPTVFNASSMTMDANNDIWIVTNTNPAKVVRVYEDTPNVWLYAVTSIG